MDHSLAQGIDFELVTRSEYSSQLLSQIRELILGRSLGQGKNIAQFSNQERLLSLKSERRTSARDNRDLIKINEYYQNMIQRID